MPFDGLVGSISSSYNGKFLYQVGILKSYSGPDYPGWQTNMPSLVVVAGLCLSFQVLFCFFIV